MAIDFATLGGVRVSGEWVRAMSDEPIPDTASPGLNIPQVIEVADKLHVHLSDYTGSPWLTLAGAIAKRRAALVQGLRVHLPTCPSGTDFDGPHMILVYAMRPSTGISGAVEYLVADPLCQSPLWIPGPNLRKYAESFGVATGLNGGGLRFALTRNTPLLAGI